MNSTRLIFDAALADLHNGISVVPIVVGEKLPAISWIEFQKRLPVERELRAWFERGSHNMGKICGKVSGNLELIDLDNKGEQFEDLRGLVDEVTPGLWAKLVIERTPSGGYHLVYRCRKAVIPGNMKLASRGVPAPSGDDFSYNDKKVKPRQYNGKWFAIVGLIETRGEGGQFLCAPNPGYELIQGDYQHIPELAAADRETLLCACRALNEWHPPQAETKKPQSSPKHVDNLSPADEYNARTNLHELMQKHGWTKLHTHGNKVHYRRPGKTEGISASIIDDTVFYCFSSNGAPFESDRGYSKFQCCALLEHNGDESAAATVIVKARPPKQFSGTRRSEFEPRRPEIRNFELKAVQGENEKKTETKRAAMPLPIVANSIITLTKGFPKRVGNLLFVQERDAIRLLPTADHLFAWLAGPADLSWASGNGYDGRTFTPKSELVAHFQATAEAFDAVEELPHQPQLAGHFYTWKPPAGYKPTGEHLAGLLDFFNNYETPEDKALIRAMVLTPTWGGPPGTRPAFPIMKPDRGCGASTLADVVAQLYGGPISIEPDGKNEERIVSRLLTESCLTKRVVTVDNIKIGVSSSLLESIITAMTISGYRLYHGDASRPNTLTLILTGNGLRLSRDIAERSFIIRLKKPAPRPEWRENVSGVITKHRDRILADIVAELRKAPVKTQARDRWQSWIDGVLTRCGHEVADIVALNQARRNESDDDLEESTAIMDALDLHISALSIPDDPIFVSSTVATNCINSTLNTSWTAKRAANVIQAHVEAGRLPRVTKERTMHGKGYKVRRMPCR